MGNFRAMVRRVFAGAAAAVCTFSAVAQTQKAQPTDDFSRLPILIDAALGGKTGKVPPLGGFTLLPFLKRGVVEVGLTERATGREYTVKCPVKFEKGFMPQWGGPKIAGDSYDPKSGDYVRFEADGTNYLVGTTNVKGAVPMPLSAIPTEVRSVYAEGKLRPPLANIVSITTNVDGKVSTKQVAPKAEFKVQGDWNWTEQFGAADAKYTTDAKPASLMTPERMLKAAMNLRAVCATMSR